MPDFEPLAITETNDDTALSEPTALALLCEVATNEAPPPIRISRPRKRRTCEAVLNGRVARYRMNVRGELIRQIVYCVLVEIPRSVLNEKLP